MLAEALRRFSGAEFLYFADEDHVPYGTKSRAQIVRLSLDAVGFLVSRGAEAIVVACNTATSAAISELRGAFSVPVIGMEPAVKLAADSFGARPTLLIATPLTIAGEKLARLVGRLECETWSLPLPRLVEFAQDLEFDSPTVRAYLRKELGKFELERLGSLVLGCTHFNYFKDVLREILPPHVRIIDGIDGTLNRLASELGEGLKLARGEDLPSLAAKFNADGGVKFGANPSAQGGKFEEQGRGAGGGQSVISKSKQGSEGCDESCGDEQGAERCDERGGKIYYPNGNSVEYFYSGRALDAAQLRKVELFLKRLDAMRAID